MNDWEKEAEIKRPSWTELTRSYSVWDEKQIKGFFGEYRFLSNFEPAICSFGGLLGFPTSENAYQAAKVSVENRSLFYKCSAAESKKLWKQVGSIYKPEEWDKFKYGIMAEIVFSKFLLNETLRNKLLATGDKYLEETNHWNDKYWGIDYKTGVGKNNLGKLLMKVREFWK